MTIHVRQPENREKSNVGGADGENIKEHNWLLKLEMRDTENNDFDRGGKLCVCCRGDSQKNTVDNENFGGNNEKSDNNMNNNGTTSTNKHEQTTKSIEERLRRICP